MIISSIDFLKNIFFFLVLQKLAKKIGNAVQKEAGHKGDFIAERVKIMTIYK